jgi:ABC-type long-subunit fatty acid transport system fused permease/ATPase subunit
MADETQSVRITQHMIYQKQLEMNDTQIKMLQKLDNLEGVPDRIREVELELARLAWIERIAYAGLTGAVVAIIGLLINTIGK